jgi:hypothetical protein
MLHQLQLHLADTPRRYRASPRVWIEIAGIPRRLDSHARARPSGASLWRNVAKRALRVERAADCRGPRFAFINERGVSRGRNIGRPVTGIIFQTLPGYSFATLIDDGDIKDSIELRRGDEREDLKDLYAAINC